MLKKFAACGEAKMDSANMGSSELCQNNKRRDDR